MIVVSSGGRSRRCDRMHSYNHLDEEDVAFDRKAHEKMKRVSTKNGSIGIAFAPDSVFMIPKDNNARLGSKWK